MNLHKQPYRAPLRLLLCLTTIWGTLNASAAQPLSEHQQLAKSIFKELIEIDTTHATGSATTAAQAMHQRLAAAGLPKKDLHVIEPVATKGNLVARLRSPNPKHPPILLLAHIDVVGADPADWSVPPFQFLEKEGYYYGRGTTDDKAQAAIWVANLIRMHQEGFEPNRDIIVALTADEEGGDANGVVHLLAEHKPLIDAQFALSEGGYGLLRNGERVANTVQIAEKVYQSFQLETTNPGGHSSLPRPDNAIYDLADAIKKIAGHQFPVELNGTTRALFSGSRAIRPNSEHAMLDGLLSMPPKQASLNYFAARPADNVQLRTTCVATQLKAGHAENALPQRAQATINCRIMPGTPPASILEALVDVVDNPNVSISPIAKAISSPPSRLTDEVMQPVRTITEAMWPGVAVLPTMSSGATDALFLRNAGIQVFGITGIFVDMNDIRMHGKDERILQTSFYESLEFLDRLVRAYSAP